MGVKGKICVVFLVFAAVLLVSATVSFGRSDRDPEIGTCKVKCEEIKGVEQDEKLKCKQQCEKYHQEKQRRERESGQGRGGRGGGSGGSGGGAGGQYDIIFAEEAQQVQKMVGECHQICQGSQGEQQHPQCFQSCMQKRFQQKGKQRGRSSRQEQQSKSNNPYVFEDYHFTTRLETEQGNVRFLQKFTDRSDLFRGIEKYRVAFLEAEPQTFIVPNHWDADCLCFVVNGEGTVSLIKNKQDSRESHNIKRGDIFRLPAGISGYLINRHNNEKLVLAKILRSISVPGELQTFLSAGGDNPESSFFNAFSTEVLEAAFDTDRDTLERVFWPQKQEQGIFKKATEEQIKSLAGGDDGGIWPFGEKKGNGPYNIYKKTPSVANENGILHEVDSDDFNDLRNINVAISFYNITQGSMAGPFYHTKATVVLAVTNGEGQFEMACPHLSEQASGRSGDFNPRYEKVSSRLRRGTVVVIPVGHPVVIEASGNQNLEVVSFGLNSDENEWFPLAGRDNVMSQWEDEAMELTFGVPAKEVQRVIEKQNKRLFFKAPVRRGRAFA